MEMLGFQNDERSMARNNQGGLVKYAGLNGNALLYAIVATATTGFSLFGYDQGLMSGIISAPQFNREFPAVSLNFPPLALSSVNELAATGWVHALRRTPPHAEMKQD